MRTRNVGQTREDRFVGCLDWYSDGKVWRGLDGGTITVAEVRFADEGEAEGGLIELARFIGAALAPEIKQPAPSPAGWYWQATIEGKGVWTRPHGPFTSAEKAVTDCDAAYGRKWGV